MNTQQILNTIVGEAYAAMSAAQSSPSYSGEMSAAYATARVYDATTPADKQTQEQPFLAVEGAINCAIQRAVDKVTVGEVASQEESQGIAYGCASQEHLMNYSAIQGILEGLKGVFLQAFALQVDSPLEVPVRLVDGVFALALSLGRCVRSVLQLIDLGHQGCKCGVKFVQGVKLRFALAIQDGPLVASQLV